MYNLDAFIETPYTLPFNAKGSLMTLSTRTFVPALPKFAPLSPEAPMPCDALNLEQAAQFLGISKKVLKRGLTRAPVPA